MPSFSARPLAASFGAPPFLQGRRRWEWLIASIALNLILIGLVLSFLLGARHHQPLVTWQMDLLPSLDAADAAIVSSATQRITDQQNGGDARIHLDYTKVRALLRVETPDRHALQEMFDDIAVTRNAEQTTINGIFLDELMALSPDGRAKTLAAMERESRRYAPPSGR
jgi:hypothetical protein